MKRLRLLTLSATAEIGGVDINLSRLLKNLNNNEYEILHLIPYPGPIVDEFIKAGIGLEIVDMPRLRLFKNPIRYILFILKFFPTVFKIKKIIEEYKIDIVCTSTMVNLYGALAAKLAHKPHILLAMEYLPLLRVFSPYFYLFSERIICCSNLVSRMFKKSDKVLVEYPSIDLTEFNPHINGQNISRELDVNGNLVSMITRLDKWKGPEAFIRAATYVKNDVKLIIFAQLVLGKEKYLKHLENLIRKLKLEEKVFIKILRSSPQLIAACDIIVHSSLRPEPFGLIIIEAMALGKPVIASNLGAPLEIISDGVDGLLREPNEPKVLAQTISKLLEDPKTAKEMGSKARQKVENKFNLKEYVRSMDSIFKGTVKAYLLKQAKLSLGKNKLVKLSAPLAKLLVGVSPQARDIDKDRIKKILVIQLFGMGDLICSLPLLEALKGYFANSRITLLIDAGLSELVKIMGKYEIAGYEKGVLSKSKLISHIRRAKFDLAVVLNPLFQGAWVAYLSQAKYRLGYIYDYDGIQGIGELSCLLTHIVPTIDEPLHDFERYIGIARFLDIDSLPLSLPCLNIPDSAQRWTDDFLRDNGMGEKDFIFGINPNAAWESRCWARKNFAKAADIMVENYNARVIFFGSSLASDMHRIETIMSMMKHKAISAAGRTDIAKLAALFNKCSVFLTNDSGPMHLSAALGTAMVVLSGPGDINKFGYKKENIINLTADHCFCKPCVFNYQYKNNCQDNRCMKDIQVARVVKALDLLISRKTRCAIN